MYIKYHQLFVTIIVLELFLLILFFLGFAITVAVDAQTKFSSDLSKRGRVVEGCD